MDLVPQPNLRANIIIEIIKGLHEKLKNKEPLFKSLKQFDWALELLGSAFVPPQYYYISHNANYLESVLAIYEYILCGKVELELEGRRFEFYNIEVKK